MKRRHLRFGHGFKVIFGNRRSQTAQMVVAPGNAEGGPGNLHRGADQWLFVVAGRGVAKVRRRRYPLAAAEGVGTDGQPAGHFLPRMR